LLLHHEPIKGGPEPDHWIFFLHGVFGAGRNWASVAKRVVEARPEWGIVLVDLREHGRSLGFPGPHTLAACARDLAELSRETEIPVDALLGHSFGGKVGLVYAAEEAGAELRQLWVIDSLPSAVDPRGSAWEMLEALRSVPRSFESRADGVAALEAKGVAPATAEWMSTNLVRASSGQVEWRLDPASMEELLRDFFRVDAWSVIDAPPANLDVHVVKAEESSLLRDPECRRIEEAGNRSGRVHLHRVAGGHWVNADNPQEMVRLLVEGLPR
jgi:pimeloyl-ACP methyl ester carboxylesterase